MRKNPKTIFSVLLTCFLIATMSTIVAVAENANPANTDGFQLATVPESGGIVTVNKDPNTGEWKSYCKGVEIPYNGLASNQYGIWYCDNGRVDFSYSGIVASNGDKWLVQDGKVNDGFDGEYSENGFIQYTFVGGRVEKIGLTKGMLYSLSVAFLFFITLAITFWLKRIKKKQKTAKPKSAVLGAPTRKTKMKVFAKPESPLISEEAAEGSADLPYRKKYLLTKNEYRFYKKLRPIADTLGLDVLAKIRMGDLVQPLQNPNKSEWYSQWGKIKSRHVDFALVDPASMYVKLLIELDDASHNDEQAKEIDQFKNDVYASAGYKLLRVQNEKKLEEKIRWMLKE